MTLPTFGDAPFELRDDASDLRIRVRMSAAAHIAAATRGERGELVFAHAVEGATWTLRSSFEGVEDYVAFDTAPHANEVRYLVDVGGASGLRSVAGSNVVEFVDAKGVPRLRMAAPVVVDRMGSQTPVEASIERCQYDTNPEPPWAHSPVSPQADHCVIALRWTNVVYPAVLDPRWSTTGSLALGRVFHVGTRFPPPRANEYLVSGGSTAYPNTPSSMTATAEVFNGAPGIQSWATTGSMATARYLHDQVEVGGEIVAVGGVVSGLVDDPSVESYSVASGTWSSRPPMVRPRYSARSTASATRLYVTGGTAATASRDSSDVFDGTSWTITDTNMGGRGEHTATLLANGTLFVAGGLANGQFSVDSVVATTARLEVPSGSLSWAAGPSLLERRFRHGARRLADGRVILFGGVRLDPAYDYLKSTEIYDPTTGASGSMSSGPEMVTPGEGAESASLEDGRILVGHGVEFTQIYEPAANRWLCAGRSILDGLNGGRDNMAELASHDVLMAGNLVNGTVSPVTTLWNSTPRSRGESCTCAALGTTAPSAECSSGFCVEGRCGCGADADCTIAPEGPLCSPSRHVCASCIDDSNCGSPSAPRCDVTLGSCVPCNGDFGSTAAFACTRASSPHCSSGMCGSCTSNADCSGVGHAGPICDRSTGLCGATCFLDADCSSGFCNIPGGTSGVCVLKAANGRPLPLSTCTPAAAKRECQSAVCDPKDGLCGAVNGDACLSSDVCRSGACDPDGACGTLNGAPCSSGLSCRSGVCSEGACGRPLGAACTAANECRSATCGRDGACGNVNGQPCTSSEQCRVGLCGSDGKCGRADGSIVGDGGAAECRSGVAAGGVCGRTDDGQRTLRGGGASCAMSPARDRVNVSSPLLLAAVVAFVSRKRRRP